jgi:hypothetical protein
MAPQWRLADAGALIEVKGRKVFFFEKKNQKTFIYFTRHQIDKSFLLLFFKKEDLPFWTA